MVQSQWVLVLLLTDYIMLTKLKRILSLKNLDKSDNNKEASHKDLLKIERNLASPYQNLPWVLLVLHLM